MKPIRALLSIVFLVTFFGSVLCDRDSNCPRLGSHSSPMHDDVFQTGNTCAEMGATSTTAIELQRAKTIEDYRTFFRGYCQRQGIVRECLARATKQYELCQNETYVHAFNTYKGFLQTILDVECSGEGVRLAKFWRGLHTLLSNTTEADKIVPCFFRMTTIAKDMEGSDIDVASKVFIFYIEMHWFKGCIHEAELEPEFTDIAGVFLTEILKRMYCLNPLDTTYELCSTIDPSSIRKINVCSLKNPHKLVPMYDALEDEAGRCFNALFEFDQPPFLGEVDRDLLDNVAVCYYKNIFICLDYLSQYSQRCMDVTQQNEFRILGDFLKNFFAPYCSEDGQRTLIDVLLEVYRQKKAGHGNAVWDCVDVAKSTRNVTDEHGSSSKNMRFYHELDSFKTCLVNKLRGDQTSGDAATSLIDEMLASVNCLYPENGTTVLCKSILS